MTVAADEFDGLFAAYARGDSAAFGALVARLYDELKRIAHGQLRRGRPAALETTALVHEAYVKLVSGASAPARDREHFFAVCARAMRHLVVDHARAAKSGKRGGGDQLVPLDTSIHLVAAADSDLTRVHEALERLEAVNPKLVRLVELRVFAGFTEAEAAELSGTPLRSVQRDWQRAKAWLKVELEGGA
jgi:RNA polymerase sigma factor (TIGR02999 family)